MMKRSFRKNIILLLGCIIGALLIPYLSIQLNPSPHSNQLRVSYQLPNASPELVEQEVSARLERVLATLRGLEEIRSVSQVGGGYISLSFDVVVDMEKKRSEVAMLLRQVYPRLHSNVSFPIIDYKSEFDQYTTLLVYTIASSTASEEFEYWVEEQIIRPLSTVKGVHDIVLSGLRLEEFRIVINEEKRKQIDLSQSDIKAAIQQYLSQQELGLAQVITQDRLNTLAVRLGRQADEDDPTQSLSKLPISKVGERVLLLREIAKIERTQRKPSSYYRINGKRAVNLIFYADPQSNQIQLGQLLKTKMDELQQSARNIVRFDLVKDETAFLTKELKKIGWRVGMTFLLLFLFMTALRPQASYLLVIWIGLFAVLLISIIFYYSFGLELHLYSIAGWTLSIGIVLDNLIVMVDHIRHHDNRLVFPALVAASLTTIGALSIVFFIEEEYREILSDFSWIFTINLLVSLLIALFFIQALQQNFSSIRPKRQSYSVRRKRWVGWFNSLYRQFILGARPFRSAFLLLSLLAFGLPLFLLPQQLEADHWLKEPYNRSLGSSYFQTQVLPIVEKYLGGTLRLFHKKKDQFSFRPEKQEATKLFLRAKMPFGGTMEQLNEVLQGVEQRLVQYSEIEKYETRINGPDRSVISISFKDGIEQTAFPYYLKGQLESWVVETGSADFAIYGVGQGFNNEVRGANLSTHIQLLGYNYETLWRLAESAQERFLGHLRIEKAFINAERTYFEPSEEYFQLNLPSSANLKNHWLSPNAVGTVLHAAQIDQGNLGWINGTNQRYPIRLYSADTKQNQLWNLGNEPYRVDSSRLIKPGDYLQLNKEKGQQKIIRINQEYQLVLSYDFIGNFRLARRVMDQKVDSLNQELPMGYRIRATDYISFWNTPKGGNQMLWMIIGALLSIFIINAILFNSIRQAFIPILLILPAYIGIFLCVSFLSFEFDQGGFASFLLVAGLSVNAALFIINDYNNYRKKWPKRSELDCFLKAFNTKIIPILLTALSTILGLLPFILFDDQQDFWYPLAICTIGGLLASILALYFLFPLIFMRMPTKRKVRLNILSPKAKHK